MLKIWGGTSSKSSSLRSRAPLMPMHRLPAAARISAELINENTLRKISGPLRRLWALTTGCGPTSHANLHLHAPVYSSKDG